MPGSLLGAIDHVSAVVLGFALFVIFPVSIALVMAVYTASKEPEPIVDQLLRLDVDDWHKWIFLTGYLMPFVVVSSFIVRLLGGRSDVR